LLCCDHMPLSQHVVNLVEAFCTIHLKLSLSERGCQQYVFELAH